MDRKYMLLLLTINTIYNREREREIVMVGFSFYVDGLNKSLGHQQDTPSHLPQLRSILVKKGSTTKKSTTKPKRVSFNV